MRHHLPGTPASNKPSGSSHEPQIRHGGRDVFGHRDGFDVAVDVAAMSAPRSAENLRDKTHAASRQSVGLAICVDHRFVRAKVHRGVVALVEAIAGSVIRTPKGRRLDLNNLLSMGQVQACNPCEDREDDYKSKKCFCHVLRFRQGLVLASHYKWLRKTEWQVPKAACLIIFSGTSVAWPFLKYSTGYIANSASGAYSNDVPSARDLRRAGKGAQTRNGRTSELISQVC
jgi:hypothetical protein